ncbi:MAG: CDP-glucose 4,6-dehydratase [Pirellula sp.]
MFLDAYKGKRVLVTGSTGFKGGWLTHWLLQLGAEVLGYSLEPKSDEILYGQLGLGDRIAHQVYGDIRDGVHLAEHIETFAPDFVFHLAAQPLVRHSYQAPKETFEINVMGTVNLLQALVGYSKPCAVVVVTSDKCYRNEGSMEFHCEEDALGGRDPYSASKGCAELVTAAYRSSFFSEREHPVHLASARSGNVIGGGDWSKDRIVPDIMRAVFAGEPIVVRNSKSTRPWQHVLEPLSGYLWLAAQMNRRESLCSAFNFGPEKDSHRTVMDLVEAMICHTGGRWIDSSIPNQPHESTVLNLAIDKAIELLNWRPSWSFDTCVLHTADWYQSVQSGLDPVIATDRTIRSYIDDAIQTGQVWAN